MSDRGQEFSSRFWRAFCQLLGAPTSLSLRFHSELNSQTETFNQDPEHSLQCLGMSLLSSWDLCKAGGAGLGPRKFGPSCIGPYKISHYTTLVAYHPVFPQSLNINPTFHMSQLKPVLSTQLPWAAPATQLPQHTIDSTLAFGNFGSCSKRRGSVM